MNENHNLNSDIADDMTLEVFEIGAGKRFGEAVGELCFGVNPNEFEKISAVSVMISEEMVGNTNVPGKLRSGFVSSEVDSRFVVDVDGYWSADELAGKCLDNVHNPQ